MKSLSNRIKNWGQYGLALQFADESLKADRDIVLAAIKQNGSALQFAATSLKVDEEIITTAIIQDSQAGLFPNYLRSVQRRSENCSSSR